jgi:hypothetical protein
MTAKTIVSGQRFGGKLGTVYNIVMTLSETEERLVEVLRTLPPAAADSLVAWATQLSDLARGRPADWSDTWTEEDQMDLQRASLSNFEHETGAL